MDIKILIAAHKKYWTPDDEAYVPVHAGKKGKKDIGYQGDDTADSISEKNPNYCELTVLYWAWKNIKCEYIGLCHYRRYFARQNIFKNKRNSIFKKHDYEKALQNSDIVLPKKRNYRIETVRSQYEHAHRKKDLDETEKIINEYYPEYKEAFSKTMNSRKLHLYNMFVMKKELFDEYCRWLFDILFRLEKRTDISSYNAYEARVFGFLGERLFNVWIEKKKLKIKEEKVVCLERTNWIKKIGSFIYRKYKN